MLSGLGCSRDPVLVALEIAEAALNWRAGGVGWKSREPLMNVCVGLRVFSAEGFYIIGLLGLSVTPREEPKKEEKGKKKKSGGRQLFWRSKVETVNAWRLLMLLVPNAVAVK